MEEHEHDLHLAEEQRVLGGLAPELISHVHAFLHGGEINPGKLPLDIDYSGPSIKLRQLQDTLSQALFQRKPLHDIMILTTAVRIQSVVLYETIKVRYGH